MLASTPVRRRAPWQNYVLGLACIGAIIAAYELVGPPSTTPSTEVRTTTAELGVVQTTVSASGNLAPASEADLNFKSSGILTGLYVQAGQHVTQGQLLAAIDPTSASVALQEAEANLQAAQAKLAETEANPSAGSGSGVTNASAAAFTGPSGASGATVSTGTTGTTGSSSATGATSPATQHKTTTTKKKASSAESAVTQATDAANIASAEASVSSAKLTVKTDESELNGTKLYAPSSGTIASISGAVGDEVTAGSGSSSSGSGDSGSGSSGSGLSSASAAATSSSSSSSTSSSSSSGSAFIVLADLSSMQLVVSVSEADIGTIKVGQPATISVDALPDEEFAAKVTAISLLSSSSSGVVSYDVTIKLTQGSSKLRPGMTATATIITGQVSDAVNVESAAISSRGTGSTVTLDNNGKMTVTPVITGLVGSSTTQIVAGLKPGEEVAIPISTSIATSTTTTGSGTLGSSSTLSGLGGGGFGGGGFARLRGG